MEKKKNIAILVKNLTVGGAEKQSILLAKSLVDTYRVHYIIFNGNIFDEKYLNWLKEDGSVYVTQLHGNVIHKFISFCRYLKNSSADVLFSYLTAANFYTAVAGYIVGVKQIYPGIRSAKLSFLKMQIDKFIGNNLATKIILNFYSGKDYYIKKGYRKEKVVVIPNCFEKIAPYTEKANYEIIHIITVGRFVPEKDYYTALCAIAGLRKYHRNIRYQIVGFGKLEPYIRRWVKNLQLEDIVDIYEDSDDISRLLRNANIYLSTSLIEGTSNAIMEALNASLPVVSTDVGDSPELVKDGVNGYITRAGDVEYIMQKLELLLSNSELRSSMGLKSNELLRNNFSTDIFKKRYIDLIEN